MDRQVQVVAGNAGLRVRGLRFAYRSRGRAPRRAALDGCDLDVAPGSRVGLLGPNGSGKSTLIKIICGLLPPDAGTVEVCGHTRAAEIRPCLSVVFQFIALDRHLTVYENLRDQAVLYGIPHREAAARIASALDGAGLADRRDDAVKALSRGLARRADLARALLHRPSLLLLDEPTSGLDPGAREAFLNDVLAGGERAPSMILMSTHLVDEADRCDRVIMLHEGRVVADGTPRDLRLGPEGSPLITLASAAALPDVKGIRWERGAGGTLRGRAEDASAAERCVARLAALGAAFSYDPSAAWSLAEVFERLTGRPLASPPQEERLEDRT